MKKALTFVLILLMVISTFSMFTPQDRSEPEQELYSLPAGFNIISSLMTPTPATTYDWPMFRHDPQRTGFTEGWAPTTDASEWNYTAGGILEVCTPVAIHNKIVVSSQDGGVRAFDIFTGDLIWSQQINYNPYPYFGNFTVTHNSIGDNSYPSFTAGTVYVGSMDGKVYALDEADGKLLWSVKVGNITYGSTATSSDKVFVNADDRLYALDALTGNILWSFGGNGGVSKKFSVADGRVFLSTIYPYLSPLPYTLYSLNEQTGEILWGYKILEPGREGIQGNSVYDGIVYVSTSNPYDLYVRLYALDALTGTLKWTTKLDGLGGVTNPVVSASVVVVGTNGIYALDARTGKLLWTYKVGDLYETPTIANGKVFIYDGKHSIQVFTLSTGQLVWSRRVGWVSIYKSAPAYTQGLVFIGTLNGRLHALKESNGEQVWSNFIGGEIWSSPAIADGKVFISSLDNKVHAIDVRSGTQVWVRSIFEGWLAASPTYFQGKVYVVTDIGAFDRVFALDAATGSTIWSYEVGIHWDQAPLVVDGKLFIGARSFIYELDASSGALLNTFIIPETVQPGACSSIAYNRGTLFVRGPSGKIYAIDENTGRIKWSYKLTTEDVYERNNPVVANGRVYITSKDFLYALNENTGEPIFRSKIGERPIPTWWILDILTAPAIAYGKAYVGTSWGEIYAIDAMTGKVLWNKKTTGPILSGLYSSAPSVAGNMIFVGSFDNMLYVLDSSSGDLIRSYTTGGPIGSSPAIAYGMVYFASFDGNVYAVRVPVGPKAKWTFMVYLDGDNNLEEDVLRNLNEMERVGSTPDVNILVLIDRHAKYDASNGNWTTTRLYKVKEDNDVKKIGSELIEDMGELNMGDPKTLAKFIVNCMKDFPAGHYALVIMGHGSGWYGICQDETNGFDRLNMSELKKALIDANTSVDVLAFESCLMGMVEVANQIKDYVKVIVGSEDYIRTLNFIWKHHAFPYNTILTELTTNPGMDAKKLSQTIVEKFKKEYELDVPFLATLSAIDLSKIKELVSSINDLSKSLIDKLDIYKTQITTLRSLITKTHEEYGKENLVDPQDDFDYIDLYYFAQLVKQHIDDKAIQSRADNIIDNINSLIIVEWHQTLHLNSHGLSIYFPETKAHYGRLYAILDFSVDCLWDYFLSEYLEKVSSEIKVFSKDSLSGIPFTVDGISYKTPIILGLLKGTYDFGTVPIIVVDKKILIFTHWEDETGVIMTKSLRFTYNVQKDERFCAVFEQLMSETLIELQETYHKLYLHIYDAVGRHVGMDYATNQVEIGIPGAIYHEFPNGTLITLPPDVIDFYYVVDAKYAMKPVEGYNVTITTLRGGSIISKTAQSEVIQQGEKYEYGVKVSSDTKAILVEKVKEVWWQIPIFGVPTYLLFIIILPVVVIGVIISTRYVMRHRKERA